jgi:hypothetical protein
MQGLSPPPTRHRASSIRSALSRRRSSSCLTETTPPLAPLTIDPLPPQPSMLVIVAARFLEWLHLQPKHSFSWSTPSSPRSATDEYVLPLSASTFADDKPPFSHPSRPSLSVRSPLLHSFIPRSPPSQLHAPILIVILLFPISTALVLVSLATLPISLTWPKTIADVALLGKELNSYTQSGTRPTAHVVGVLAITAIWKHAWSIPGSVIWVRISSALCHIILIYSFFLERCLRSSLLSSVCNGSSYSSHHAWFCLCNIASDSPCSISHPFFPSCFGHDP